MPPGSRLDLAARAEKRESHRESLALMLRLKSF